MMAEHASTENCPCCLGCLAPGPDTDRALVLAFIAGVTARDQNVPMARALCRLHADIAHDALSFVALEWEARR